METAEAVYLDKRSMQAGGWYHPSAWDTIRDLISGLDQTKLAILADSSHWTGKLTPAVVAGAHMWSMKATDGEQIQSGSPGDLGNYKDSELNNTIQTCYDVGVPAMPYHFFQWKIQEGWNRDQVSGFQADIILAALDGLIPGKSYHAFCLDLETLGDTSTNYQWKVADLYTRLMKSPQINQVPFIFYTSDYILGKYPALKEWLIAPGTNRNLWLAQWTYTKKWSGRWSDFMTTFLPALPNMRVVTPSSWWAAQYSASVYIDGFNLDLSSCCRSREKLYEWLGYKTTPTPPQPPPQPGTIDWAQVRADGHTAWDAFVDQEKAKVV